MSNKNIKEKVFERDGHKCIICGRSDLPLDAHHIIERRLWEDGGWYLDNLATLCDNGKEGCHYKAEQTKITIEEIISILGIKKPMLPEDMYEDQRYDKWGNVYLNNGKRSKGPLFHDESVQKVLSDVMDEFTDYYKYPRTYHCPWSEGITEDDKVNKTMDSFKGKEVVVTVKMDGENTSIYKDYFHARSLDSNHHYTRDWAKSYAMNYISPNIPEGWRICAENLYAVHSIKYENLNSYLLGFSIWNDKNECLSWDETKEYFELLDMPHVEVLYEGIYDEDKIKGLYDDSKYEKMEGYVIRLRDSFKYKDFKKSVAKFVRKNHVQSSKHWIKLRVHPTNELKEGIDMTNVKYKDV